MIHAFSLCDFLAAVKNIGRKCSGDLRKLIDKLCRTIFAADPALLIGDLIVSP